MHYRKQSKFPSKISFLLESLLNLTLIWIVLSNIGLSNFTFSSMLSFADKPNLAYLTRHTKKCTNCLQKITRIQIWHWKVKWTLNVSLYVANPSKSQTYFFFSDCCNVHESDTITYLFLSVNPLWVPKKQKFQ